MKTTRLIAVMVGLAITTLHASSASAMYNPSTGTWMQRDPGNQPGSRAGARLTSEHGTPLTQKFTPRDQYRDGMGLYQYTRSSPCVGRDPHGMETENEIACTCGPDVTDWFRKELRNQAEYVANMYGDEAQSELGTSTALTSFAEYAKTKMEMSKGMEYKSRAC